MNERIKQCMFNAGLNSNYVEGFDSIYSQQLEKFAELIVKECAQVAADFVPGYGLEPFSKRFNEHYGVEE